MTTIFPQFKKSIFYLIIFDLIFLPLTTPLQVQAESDTQGEKIQIEELGPDLENDPTVENKTLIDLETAASRLEVLNNLDPQHPRIILSEQDLEAVRTGKIDERLLKALIYLVTPADEGGGGFDRLKIKRLVKGYTVEKRALSRETEYPKEGEANISAHYKGQAVDISEIDSIKMRKKTKKSFLGVTYSSKSGDLPSTPIQVSWQSEKGKGEGIPGFSGDTANELFGNLSLGSIKEILGDLVDYNLDELQGENFPEWAKWLGVAVLFEDFDLPTGGFTEGQNIEGVLKQMGRATLAQSLNIDPEAIVGNSKEELVLNIGKNYVEKRAGLPSGSLTGDSLDDIFKNTGRRKLEKELGLKKGTLDGNLKEKIKQIKENAKWKAYKTQQAKDEALDMPEGSAAQIEAGDENGLRLVGAGVLLYALAAENRQDLLSKIKNKEGLSADIKIDESNLKIDIDLETLKSIFSSDKNKRNEALKTLGETTIANLAFHPDLSLNLTQDDWKKVLSGKTKIDELALTVGARKYENEFNLPQNALYYSVSQFQSTKKFNSDDFFANVGKAALEAKGENPNNTPDFTKKQIGIATVQQTIVLEMNKEYKLSEKAAKYQITPDDVATLFRGDFTLFAQKISGKQLDQALGFPENGTLDLIQGNKTTSQVLKESGAVRFGKFLGLSRPVSVEGNLRQNYGQALVEDNLGLKQGSFSGSIDEVKAKNGLNQFNDIFEKPEWVDAIFGLQAGTTKNLLEGKISVSDYSKKVADKALEAVTLDKIADYFGLGTWMEVQARKDEIDKLVKTVSNWDNASADDRTTVFNTLESIAGKSWDQALGFEEGSLAQIVADPSNAPDILITQGMKKLNTQIFGIDKDVLVFHYKDGQGLDVSIDGKALQEWATPKIKEQTGITNDDDAKNFLNGNIKDGFTFWGIAAMTKEANDIFDKNGLSNAKFTYDDARNAYLGDPNEIESQYYGALVKIKTENPARFNALTDAEKAEIRDIIRKDVVKEGRKDFQYKLYDSYLIDKVDPSIPIGFTKTMYEGTPEERSVALGSYALAKMTKGEISLTSDQLNLVNLYIQNKTPENFQKLTDSGVFNNVDNYLNTNDILGFKIQNGTSAALIKMTQGGEQFKQGFKDLTNIYTDWAIDKVFAFADKKILGVTAGTTYKIYQQYKTYKSAYDAYKAAKLANDAAAMAEASEDLGQAKAAAAQFVIHLVAGKTFSKIDQKFNLPAGTTEGLLMYLVWGNPVGLIMAVAAKYLFSVKVEFYGQKPVCENTAASSSNTALMAGISNLFGLTKLVGYEKLSGDPEKDFPFYQRHAQCSVKRLLGALLEMPDKTGDRALKPIQILTQRQEDVNYYADKIYALYGKTQAERGWRGLMSSDMFWQWVHVGY